MSATIDQDARPCPRCGEDHGTLTFRQLARAITDRCDPPLTHWAPCPSTDEPILARAITSTSISVATVPVVTLRVDEVTGRRIRRAIEGEGGDA